MQSGHFQQHQGSESQGLWAPELRTKGLYWTMGTAVLSSSGSLFQAGSRESHGNGPLNSQFPGPEVQGLGLQAVNGLET